MSIPNTPGRRPTRPAVSLRRCRQAAIASLAFVGALAEPLSAADDLYRRLDRSLAAIEQGSETQVLLATGADVRAAPRDLRSLLGELAERDAAREREFAALAGRRLPGPAAQRLEQARAAHRAPTRRLLEILRAVAEQGAVESRDTARVELVARVEPLIREARELLEKIDDARRPEPISAAESRVRAPELQAPALGIPLGATTGGPVGPVPQVLKDVAAGLAGPVEIYEWVRNSIAPDFYYGAMKGAIETYVEGSGNDADTAALLVELLRAKGIPARYARGTVEVPGAALKAVCGTTGAEQAVRVLARAGVPHEVVVGGGGVASVKLERVWVEAYVPYANYRGVLLDAQGKVWIPLDAAFKRRDEPVRFDVAAQLGFDARQVWDEYVSRPQPRTPLEDVRARVVQLLAERRPDVTYDDVTRAPSFGGEGLGVLPASLPYAVLQRTEVSYDLPVPLQHSLRLRAERADGVVLIDHTLPIADALGKRLTLSYVPASADDEAIAAEFGGLTLTPPYLIEVRPVINSAGVAVAAGDQSIGMGVRFTLRLELRTPGGVQAVTNSLIAGNLTAVGLSGSRTAAGAASVDHAAAILGGLASAYLERWNRSDEELAAVFDVLPVRPVVSTCLVSSDIAVDYAGGDPLYPLTFEWKGLLIDADLRPIAPVGIAGREAERPFVLLSGLEGSILEHKIFEDTYDIPSVSTAKAIGLAAEQGIAIHDLDSSNVDAVLPGLPFDPSVKGEVRDAAYRGFRVRIAAQDVAYLDWHGVGYALLDDTTGEASYQLQGGHSGGVTAPAALSIPENLRDPLIRQREKSDPPGSPDAAHVEKLPSSDYQEGTVSQPLAKPFKVRVTDAEGYALKNVVVTFTVIGGGGTIIHPVSKRESTGALDVVADDRGEAAVTLVLGQKTDLIPRYVCEVGYVCEEGKDHVTQVGLNLVTARSGQAQLVEPFYAWSFPDYRRDPKTGEAFVRLVLRGGLEASSKNPLRHHNLTVASRLSLGVTDQFGNPLSNIPIRIAFRPPIEQAVPPPGTSLMRGPTTTPGGVLTPAAFEACLAETHEIIKGQCPGEEPEVTIGSSSSGVYAYPVLGDSPYSWYYFTIGRPVAPDLIRVWYGTTGLLCYSPNLSDCPNASQPAAWAYAGARYMMANALGNMVEAYPPEGEATLGFWAHTVYEKERIVPRVDDEGATYFTAEGTNDWVREALDDSDFELTPKTPETHVSRATAIGNGNYAATMTMGSLPQLNSTQWKAKAYPPLVPFLPDKPGWVDPTYVNVADPEHPALTTRVKDKARPLIFTGSVGLWGAKADLTVVTPAPVPVAPNGTAAKTCEVGHRIEPDAYRQLLEPTQVLFELRRDGQTILQANGADSSGFVIPQGLPVPPARYTAHLALLNVTKGDSQIVARPPLEVPVCNLLQLETPRVTLAFTNDPLNETTCGHPSEIRFGLCRDAVVTLTLSGVPLTALVDENPTPRTLSKLALSAGTHRVRLVAGLLGNSMDAQAPFVVHAEGASDPSLSADASGVVSNTVANRSVLPVGRTFVKGVDLFDGHLVQQATDVKIPGRHLGLELTRTYSSAGHSSDGDLGAGWAFNFGARIRIADCGLVTLTTADGSSQVFRKLADGTYKPQKGYHTRLVRGADGSFDFFDKSGTRHHFSDRDDPLRPDDQRLEYVEEPHGDRLVLTYAAPTRRIAKVAEVHPEVGAVRSLSFSYTGAGGSDRIERVWDDALGIDVTYSYDATTGSLLKAARKSADAGTLTQTYEYDSTKPLHRHRLVAVVDPNGNRTEYMYYRVNDPWPGEGSGVVALDKDEYVRKVRELPGRGVAVETELSYDLTNASSNRWKTTVKDGRGNSTVYLLNSNGSPVEIREPLSRTTRMEWASDDIYKTKETDAEGRVSEYDHDARGNLTSETIHTLDLGSVVTEYRYDTRFNKLTYKKDAEGRETVHTINPDVGDLTQTRDAVGNATDYEYDAHGRLRTTTDPRRNPTSYGEHDSFGNARQIVQPLGLTVTREYDIRGRLTSQTDSVGHRTETRYDGFDRPVEVTRHAGLGSDPERTRTEYYPAGQVRAVTNAKGARTELTLDGMGRITATAVQLPTGERYTTSTTYDANGNKETETSRRGVTRKNTHDELNRLTKAEIVSVGEADGGPTGVIAEYGYDHVGNKLWERDVAGLQTDFAYDGLYRVKRKELPEASPAGGRYAEGYVHDKVGNRRFVTDANNHTTELRYDGLNRITTAIDALGQTTTIAYDDPEGSHVQKSEEHDPTRGLRTTFLYDALGRETQRLVHLEGVGGDKQQIVTVTEHLPGTNDSVVTDARGVKTRVMRDGLDRVAETVADTDGIEGRPALMLTTTTTYDGLGNEKTVTDPRRKTTVYGHDGLGRLVRVTDALSHHTTSVYDGEGLKTREIDRRGVVKQFTYDALGRVRKSWVDPAISGVGWSSEVIYDDKGRTRTEKDALEQPTVSTLDGLGRVRAIRDPLGQTIVSTYDGVNKLAAKNKRGHTTTFEYDALNRLTKTIDPPLSAEGGVARSVVTSYDDANNRRTVTDRRNVGIVTQMDPLGRVLTVTRAGVTLETNTYDQNGNKVLGKDGEEKQTRFVFDGANRLIERQDGFGSGTQASTWLKLDANGNVEEEKDARTPDHPVVKTYDDLNRLHSVTDGEGNSTIYGYDNEGNRTSVQEPEGQTTTYGWDELGKLLTVTQSAVAEGTPVTRHTYDRNRNRRSQHDANGHVVEMTYDALGRLKTTIQHPTDTVTYTTEITRYDANGNVEELVDPKGQRVTSTYDELDRLKSRSYGFAPGDEARPWRYTSGMVYGYDANGNLTSVNESVAGGTDPPLTRTTTRTFDDLDRMTSETTAQSGADPKAVSHGYYRNGTRQSVTDPEGRITCYTYDGQNRLSHTITECAPGDLSQGSHTVQTYYPDDLVRTVEAANGVVATHTYDNADRTQSIVNAKAGTPVSSYAYTYFPNGNRKTQVEVNGGLTETTSYTYDDLSRLKTIAYPTDTNYRNGRNVTYTYDLVGNRTRETEGDNADAPIADKRGVFDAINRLTDLNDLITPTQSTRFGYDANGNQISKTVADVTTDYRYDLRDKLVEVGQGASVLGRYQYDFDGRRVEKLGDVGGIGADNARRYVYDQTSLLVEYSRNTLTNAWQPVAKYDYGDHLVSLTHATEGRRFYSFDTLGSVTNLTDDTGALAASYHLDTWGQFRFPTELDSSSNRFAFTGYIWDKETSLYNAKARYLDPKLGRFISQDSFLGSIDDPPSLHRYFYANDNPTVYVDPTGHESLGEDARKYGRGEGRDLPKAQPVDRTVVPNDKRLPSKEELFAACRARPETCRPQPENAPQPATVTEANCEGALCPALESVLQAGGRALGLLNRPVESSAQAARAIARGGTRGMAAKQDDAALGRRSDVRDLFPDDTPGDQIGRHNAETNIGRDAVDVAVDVSGEYTAEGTRQILPMVAAGMINKGGKALEGFADDAARGLKGGKTSSSAVKKPYSNPRSRPKYARGQVDEVWEGSRGAEGKVHDPNTKQELIWDKSKPRRDQWDMGHIKGEEYRKLHKDYMDGKITLDELKARVRDVGNYKPEAPAANRGHKYEEK
jgi:RHS repeat-associated protein